MGIQNRIGEFEQMALAAILHLGDDAYAVPIREKIEELASVKISRGALYTTLMRLEEKGFVTSRVGEPIARRGGRARRYFSVSEQGVEVLRRTRERLLNFWEGLEERLEVSG